MNIINILLNQKDYNQEYRFYNYYKALQKHNVKVLNITNKYTQISDYQKIDKKHILKLFNFNKYDIFAIKKLQNIIHTHQADIIIAHDEKAISLSKYANKIFNNSIPIVGICNNQIINPLIGLNSIIISLESSRKELLEKGQTPRTIYYIPDTIYNDINNKLTTNFHKTIIIGLIGNSKLNISLDKLIIALVNLKNKSIKYKIKITQIGKAEKTLKNLIIKHNLQKQVSFLDKTNTKHQFFNKIDICCFLSDIEYSTLPLLNAIKYKKPIVTVKNHASEQIIKNHNDGIIVAKDNYTELTTALETLIKNQELAKTYSNNAFTKLTSQLNPNRVSEKLINCLNEIWLKNKERKRNANNKFM